MHKCLLLLAALLLATGQGTALRAAEPGHQPSAHVPAQAAAAAPVASWEYRVTARSEPILPGEPLLMQVAWRNTSAKPADLPDDLAVRVAVQPVDGAADAGPLVMMVARRPPAARARQTIPPGQEHIQRFLMVLGRPEGSGPSVPLRLLFPSPGRYRLVGQGAKDQTPLEVSVVEPSTPENAAARRAWTAEVARGLVADSKESAALAAALGQFSADFPYSRYAAYAMWGQADWLARQGTRRGLREAARLAEAILDRHPQFPMAEDTFSALVGLYDALKEPSQARIAAEDFARAFPSSEGVARLRERFGRSFEFLGRPRLLPPAESAVAKAALTVTGIEVVPTAPRHVLSNFWKAAAEGDFTALEAMLARDFMSDGGPRTAYALNLLKERRDATAGAMQVHVTAARMATRYDRTASMPSGDERSWTGNLCVVEGRLSVRWQRAGGTDSLDAPRAAWVLYGYPDGSWKLVSETCPSRNLLAGAQAQKLFGTLRSTITSWKISDGRQERVPYEEIKARAGVAGQTIDGRAEWTSHTVVMGGPDRSEATLIGQLRVPLESADASATTEQWLQCRVTFLLGLGPDDVLILRRMDVGPAMRQVLPKSVPSGPPPTAFSPSRGPAVPAPHQEQQ